MHRIPDLSIYSVSRGISATTRQTVATFQQTIRDNLPGYETFLQGSYANDTAISEINDVDIIVLDTQTLISKTWTQRFREIANLLELNQNYRGRISYGEKCIKLQLISFKADIVPANALILGNSHNEPISIIGNTLTYPRTHIANGVLKNTVTHGHYKPIVRMFKNYAHYWNLGEIAPSYYLECLVYSYSDNVFTADYVEVFYNIAQHICYNSNFDYNFLSIAGDKQIISTTEWNLYSFNHFRNHLATRLPTLEAALNAQTEDNARRWFNEFFSL